MAKVLLIDKQAHMLELLRSKFELEGFEVFTSVSADEGLRLAEGEQPDLIVLDERLQDESGVAVADRLRESESLAEIPVILLTSRASEGSETGRDGSASSVRMPFRPSQLMALVRENL